MNKFILFVVILFSSHTVSKAQTYNDGCMNMSVKATWSWNEEYEDPFFNDESSWQWSVADNGNVDGAGYFGGGCLQQGGFFQIGWWNHSDYTMHNFSYGPLASPNATTVPQYINLRGRYEGDDCGGSCDHNNGGFFTCFGDQDDYRFNDLVSSFINYRFAVPNNDNVFQRFTNWHGSADYGGQFTVNYTSPRPNLATADISTICDDGSSGAVTLTAAGATFGGSYEWYVGAAFDYVGSGSSIVVDPILDANGGTSVVYHVYTKNGSLNSLCYKDITIDIVNCDFNCTSDQNTTVRTIPAYSNNLNHATVTTSGYPAGSYIIDVNVSTSFIKNNPNNDIGFELVASASGLSCTSTSLVNEQFAGNGQALASVLFDEQSTNSVVSGTYDPQFTSIVDPTDDLDCYNWFDPNRNWNLLVDHSGNSFFQVSEFEVEVCACRPPTSASITESGTNSITICKTQGGTLELNVSGSLGAIDAAGFGDEVRWFEDNCYTGAFAGSGNPFTISTPTTPGTYTYYANYYVNGVACDDPSVVADECQSVTIIVTEEPIAGAVVQGGNISIDICENTSPGLFTLVGSNQTVPGINITRWEVSIDGGISWTAITNALPTYNPGVINTLGTYYYRAVLTNSGCGDTYSDFITVNVFETPSAGVTSMITSGTTYCSDTVFRMSTSGYVGALQWQISTDNGLTYADIPGQSSDDLTYLISNTTELPVNYLFRVKASNSPCVDSYSSPAQAIIVYPAAVGGVLSASQDICLNGFASDVVLTNAHGDSIIWEMDDNSTFSSPTDLGHVQKVIGLDNTLTSATIGMISSTQYIRARVINEYCTDSISNVITLTSYSPPSNTIMSDQSLCIGDAPNVLIGSAPTGGNGTYSYQWQSSPAGAGSWIDIAGATNQNFDPIAYTSNSDFRRVVSSGPCDSVSAKVTVIYNVNPSFTTITPNDISCFGADDGNITIVALNTDSFSIDGGMTYSISNSFSNLTPGSYNVYIKNVHNCVLPYVANPVVIDEPLEISFTTTNINPSCSNTSNGSITINVTNGVGTLNYSLNGGGTQTGNTFSGLSAGSYDILVSDVNGCIDTSSTTLVNSYSFALNIDSVVNTSCFGQSDGAIHLGTIGGAGPFTFSIDGANYQPDSVFTGIASGLYTVYSEDANGCVASSSATILDSPPLLINLDSINNVLCNGQSTGAAYISVSGGTGAITYLWSNGSVSEDIENVPEGSYNVLVTSGGCSASLNLTIIEPTILDATLVSVTDVSCNGGSNGMIDVSVSGGTTPYSYSWSNGDTIEDLTGVIAGTFNLTVTDANDCISTVSAVVNPATTLTVVTSGTNSSCSNSSDGFVSATATGGQGPYQYSLNGGPSQSANLFTGLSAGLHTVSVVDANGCLASGTALVLNDYTMTLSSTTVNNVTCANQNDGQVQLSTSGGQAPFTFTVNGFSAQSDSLFTGLSGGNYTFEVIDANGCTDTIVRTIVENAPLVVVLDSVTDVLCAGNPIGAAYVSVSGGDGLYTFAWSGPTSSAMEDITNALPGVYNIVVSDGSGCSTSLNTNISGPTELVANISNVENVNCNGDTTGSIDVIVSGGTPNYAFSWSDGSSVVSTSEDLNNVGAGTYTLTITDDNSCSQTLSQSIIENAFLSASSIAANTSCSNSNNGSVTVSATGGQSPYNYSLNGGSVQTNNVFNGLAAGTYTIDVIDANGCTASSSSIVTNNYMLSIDTGSVTDVSCAGQNDGQVQLTTTGGQAPFSFTINGALPQSDSLFTGLSSGFYTFEVTDANGCSSTVSSTISENAPMVLSLDSVLNVLCSGDATGAAYISVNGGDGSYTFAWSGPTSSAIEDLTNAVAGAYNVSVIDGAGCSATLSVTISSPSILTANVNNIINVSCNGASTGSIDVSVAGGTPNYTYSWSDGTSVVSTSEDLYGVGAGSYVLTLTDDNTCTTTVSATITENPILSGSTSSNDILCFGDAGSASVTVSGGDAPYHYFWSNFDTASNAISLNEGMVSVIVTDNVGCTIQLFDTIHGPLADLEISATVQNATCFGLNDGSISESVTGGTPPYTVTYSPGGTNANLIAGVYAVNVIDANGCMVSESYTVTEPEQIMTSMSLTNPSCFGEQTGMAVAGTTNGTAPYIYSWNTVPVQVGMVAVNLLGDADYIVTITDVNGCVAYDTAEIVNPAEITLTTNPTSVSCISNANGSVEVLAQGGNLPYEYQLNGFLQPDSMFSNLSVGNYVVFVTDNNNCSANTSFTVSSASAMEAEIEAAGNDMNFVTDQLHIVNGETVSLNVNFINDSGNPIVGYNWIPSELDTIIDPTFMPTDNISVQLEVLEMINGNICSIYDTIQINVSQESLVFIPTAFSPNNAGQNNFFEMNVLGAENLNVQIFNRWGEVVFNNVNQGNGPNNINDPSLTDGTNPRGAWDGKYKDEDVPTGTYAYKVDVTYFDGSTKTIKGSVTIIR